MTLMPKETHQQEELLGELDPQPPTIPAHRGPMRVILAFLLALLIIVMIVPFYAIKLDPEPKNIPPLVDVLDGLNLQTTNHSTIAYTDFPLLVAQASNDQAIKTVADSIVTQSCDGGDARRVCHAKALFYFVRDNFDYVADPASFEYIKTPQESFISQGGDCDDASVLLASTLAAVGIETRFVFIPRHVFIQAYLPEAIKRHKDEDGWVNLDPTCVNCGFGETAYATANARKTIVG